MSFIRQFYAVYLASKRSIKMSAKVIIDAKRTSFNKISPGKKIKPDTIAERLQLYGIQSHLSRATFFSIRGFLKKNRLETPQIISDSVGDKQNVIILVCIFQSVSRRDTPIVLRHWCMCASLLSYRGAIIDEFLEIWISVFLMIWLKRRGYLSRSRTKSTRSDFKGRFSIISNHLPLQIW